MLGYREPTRTGVSRRVPYWAVAGLAAGAATTTWWTSGIHAFNGPDHFVGPFDVPLALEYGLAAAAIVATVAALWHIARRGQSRSGLLLASCLWLVAAAVAIPYSWECG